jgi:hypothetical protein
MKNKLTFNITTTFDGPPPPAIRRPRSSCSLAQVFILLAEQKERKNCKSNSKKMDEIGRISTTFDFHFEMSVKRPKKDGTSGFEPL